MRKKPIFHHFQNTKLLNQPTGQCSKIFYYCSNKETQRKTKEQKLTERKHREKSPFTHSPINRFIIQFQPHYQTLPSFASSVHLPFSSLFLVIYKYGNLLIFQSKTSHLSPFYIMPYVLFLGTVSFGKSPFSY